MNFWRRGKLAIAGALNLDLTHAQVHYGRFLKSQVTPGARWLEVGCGRQIVPEYAMPMVQQKTMVSRASFLVGIDVDGAILDHPLLHARVYALGNHLPFASESFDLVTANMVVEHVPDPKPFLTDIHRILRPGGRFIFHTPNYFYYLIFIASLTPEWLKGRLVWLLERRREEDRFKTFYKLNTRQEITRFAHETGFDPEAILTYGSNGSLGRLGPIGWLECLALKTLAVVKNGEYRSNLIVSFRKPLARS
jgi:SAM-dependent methyltransferase